MFSTLSAFPFQNGGEPRAYPGKTKHEVETLDGMPVNCRATYTHISIYPFSVPLVRVMEEPGVYPNELEAQGRGHTAWGANPLQGKHNHTWRTLEQWCSKQNLLPHHAALSYWLQAWNVPIFSFGKIFLQWKRNECQNLLTSRFSSIERGSFS